MTVAELINKLAEMPQDAVVIVNYRDRFMGSSWTGSMSVDGEGTIREVNDLETRVVIELNQD